jgi:hypothetical protein
MKEFDSTLMLVIPIYLVLIAVVFYFLIHAVQFIEGPVKRSYWVIVLVGLNVITIPFYFLLEFYPAYKRNQYKISFREGKSG